MQALPVSCSDDLGSSPDGLPRIECRRHRQTRARQIGAVDLHDTEVEVMTLAQQQRRYRNRGVGGFRPETSARRIVVDGVRVQAAFMVSKRHHRAGGHEGSIHTDQLKEGRQGKDQRLRPTKDDALVRLPQIAICAPMGGGLVYRPPYRNFKSYTGGVQPLVVIYFLDARGRL